GRPPRRAPRRRQAALTRLALATYTDRSGASCVDRGMKNLLLASLVSFSAACGIDAPATTTTPNPRPTCAVGGDVLFAIDHRTDVENVGIPTSEAVIHTSGAWTFHDSTGA